MNHNRKHSLLILLLAASVALAQSVVKPGELWLDDRGEPVQAHGGAILSWQGLYYWFGEDRTRKNDPLKRYVACYSSKDLVHWKFRHQVVAISDPESLGSKWILERPKVFHNEQTHRFVMYTHIDDATYRYARVAILVSDRIDGDYKYVRSFRPLDQESRDIGQFVDDDGSVYLIFESRPTKGFFIASLSRDYLNVVKAVSFLEAPLEGGAVIHYQGLYYVIGSHLTGWSPNPNVYATSVSLSGPWTTFKNIAPPEKNTYGAQSTMLLKVEGSRETTVIFMGDMWRPEEQWNSRYLWMPLQIGNAELQLPAPRNWTLNIRTGHAAFQP